MIYFNNYRGKDKSFENIGTTLDCPYIPINNLNFQNRYLEDNILVEEDSHFMYYSDKVYSNNNHYYGPYSKVYNSLSGYYAFNYTDRANNLKLQIGHGHIIDTTNDKYLLQVSVSVKYKDLDYNDISSNNITIFVSNEFLDPKYKLFYNKIYKDVILPYMAIGTEIIFTTPEKIIEKNYSDISLSFSSISEMETHLSEEVVKLLLPTQQSETQEEIEPSSESVDLPF